MSDDIGGLSVGMVNLIVILVIVGAAFLSAMGYGFWRMFQGGDLNFGPREPEQDQLNYMRQVRYHTRLGMFAASRDALKRGRDSKMTEDLESSYYQ